MDIGFLAFPGHPLLKRLEVDFVPEARQLQRRGRCRHLAPREASLLAFMLRAEAGAVINRNELLDAVWGDGEVCEDALMVIVSRLRRHFDRLGVDEAIIETVPRQGYRLTACEGALGSVRDARRDGRVGRNLGIVALVISVVALGIASATLILTVA